MARDNHLYLARHGETIWNACGRLQGRQGSALTPRGDQQARELAALASLLGVGRVLASPLDRAWLTARKVANAVSCKLEVVDALCEIDFGLCGGLTMSEVSQKFRGFMAARRVDKWNHRWPDGESYADAADRLQAWLGTETILPPFGNTMIVAHQSVNRSLISVLTNKKPPEILESKQSADVVFRLGPDKTVFYCRVPPLNAQESIRWIPGLHIPRSLEVSGS